MKCFACEADAVELFAMPDDKCYPCCRRHGPTLASPNHTTLSQQESIGFAALLGLSLINLRRLNDDAWYLMSRHRANHGKYIIRRNA